MERHNQSFFGQKTAILFDSGISNDAYAYFRFIKKTDSGWERPSENGGKAIKLSIQELICILDVLNGEKEIWNTVHKYNNDNTSLSFICENRAQYSFKFSISSGAISYVKQIIYPESKFLRILLEHIIKEKIENATGYRPLSVQEEQSEELIDQGTSAELYSMKKTEIPRAHDNKSIGKEIEKNPMENVSDFISEIQKPETQRPQVQRPMTKSSETQRTENQRPESQQPMNKNSEIQRAENLRTENQKREVQENPDYTDLIASAKIITGKAVLLEVEPGNEFWVPKSAILKGNYDLIGTPAPFSIKSWVIKNRAINA